MEITMPQSTITHGKGFVTPEKRSRSISSNVPTKQRKEIIIQQRLAMTEREIAMLKMQVHELKNTYLLLEKLYENKER